MTKSTPGASQPERENHSTRTAKGTVPPGQLLDAATISSLMHKVGHEIGNPLTSIISLAAILARFSAAPAGGENKIPHYANSIASEAWKISRLSDMLVMLFSTQSGNAAPTEAGPAIQRALNKLKTRTNIDTDPVVVQFLSAGSPIAYVDSEQFSALIAELVANALQANQQIAESRHPVEISVEQTAQTAQITVSNASAQANPYELDQLFAPLITTFSAQRHLGIGLTMALAIVHRAQGEITIEERIRPDQTVMFSVRVSLPSGPEALIKTSEPSNSSSLHASGSPQAAAAAAELLVIEDQAMVSSAIKKIVEYSLRDKTAVNCVCVSGSEALALFAAGRLFDAVLCDINLSPHNGADIYFQACKADPKYQQRFAFMTGGTVGTGPNAKSGGNGATLHDRPCLSKPFEPEQLVGLVLELLDAGRR